MELVFIQWVDSKMWGCEWIDVRGLADCGVVYCETVGFKVDENEEAILIAQSKSEDSKSNLIAIPQGCIKKRWELKAK